MQATCLCDGLATPILSHRARSETETGYANNDIRRQSYRPQACQLGAVVA